MGCLTISHFLNSSFFNGFAVFFGKEWETVHNEVRGKHKWRPVQQFSTEVSKSCANDQHQLVLRSGYWKVVNKNIWQEHGKVFDLHIERIDANVI